MNGKKFLTEAIALNMFDFETVRANCLKQQNDQETTDGGKPKVKTVKKLLWTIPIAAILVLTMTTAVLGATIPGVNNFIYSVSPEIADWMAGMNPKMAENLDRNTNPSDLIDSIDPANPIEPGQASVDPDGPPSPDALPDVGAPTGLKVTKVTDYSITLSWNTIPGAVYQIYKIYDGKGTIAVANVTSSPCVISSLEAGTTYSFYVRATTGTETSGASAIVTATTLAGVIRPVPSAPTGLRIVDKTSNSIYFTWNAVPEAQYYDIYVNGEYKHYVHAQDRTENSVCVQNDLTPGTQYTLYVRARNNSGTSSPSNVVTVTTLESSTPTGLQFETTTFAYNSRGHKLKLANKISGLTYVMYSASGNYVAGDMNGDGEINQADQNAQWQPNWNGTFQLEALPVGTHTIYVYDMINSNRYNKDTSKNIPVTDKTGLIQTITITITGIQFETTTFAYSSNGYKLKLANRISGLTYVMYNASGNYVGGDMNEDGEINQADQNAQWQPNWNGIIQLESLPVGTHTIYIYDMVNSNRYNRNTSSNIPVSDKTGFIQTITITITGVQLETTTFAYDSNGYTLKLTNKISGLTYVMYSASGNYVAGDMNGDGEINQVDQNLQWQPNWSRTLQLESLPVGTHTIYIYDMVNSNRYNRNTSSNIPVSDRTGFVQTITITILP